MKAIGRTTFLGMCLSAIAGAIESNPIEPKSGKCPVDGSDGTILGSVALEMDGKDGIGDSFFPSSGWRPDLRLMLCPKCGCLFAQKRANV